MNTNVILHVAEVRLAEKVSEIKRGSLYLQQIHDGLKDLGAENVTIEEVKSLMLSDGNIADIKRLILKDKVLQVAGMMIAKETIHFDQRALADLSRVCRSAPNSLEQGDYYEIVDGQVKCVDTLESDLRPSYTLYGSAKQKALADKLTALASEIESLREEMGATHPYHPMRNPDTWFGVDSRGRYIPNIHRIAQHVNP